MPADASLSDCIETQWAQQRWRLHHDRALHWPARATLLVADVHLGKAEHFRHAGVPMPRGTTRTNLHRLAALIHATAARRLIVLGDLFHAPTGMSEAMLDRLHAWRRRHRQLDWVVIPGNHDRRITDWPAELDITRADTSWREAGISFQHEPPEHAQPRHPVMAGHVHPAVRLTAPAHQPMRLPCFHFAPNLALLPAFGQFTGMKPRPIRRHDRVFALGPDGLADVSPRV